MAIVSFIFFSMICEQPGTRGNKLFQKKFLGSSPATVRVWATRFRHPFRPKGQNKKRTD